MKLYPCQTVPLFNHPTCICQVKCLECLTKLKDNDRSGSFVLGQCRAVKFIRQNTQLADIWFEKFWLEFG